MANVRMLFTNDFDSATVSLGVGSEVATMPLSNAQVYGNELRFISQDNAEIQINGNFSMIAQVSGLVLYRHNLSASATVQLIIYDSQNQAGKVVYDSGVKASAAQRAWTDWDWRRQKLVSSQMDDWAYKFTQIWFAAVFGQSFKIIIKDPDNPKSEIEIPRIYLGDVFEPSINFDRNNQLSIKSKSKQQDTDTGSVYTKAARRYRSESIDLNHITDAERSILYHAVNSVGIEQDFFITLYPELGSQLELESAFAAKFIDIPVLIHKGFNKHSTTFKYREC